MKTLITREDMAWLAETCNVLAKDYECAILFGNEDCPQRIDLYARDHYLCRPTTLLYDRHQERHYVYKWGELPKSFGHILAAVVRPDQPVRITPLAGWDGIVAELKGRCVEDVHVGEDFVMLCDEDGLSKKLPRNPTATELATSELSRRGRQLLPGSWVVGTAIFVGLDPDPEGDGYCSLPFHVIDRYFADARTG